MKTLKSINNWLKRIELFIGTIGMLAIFALIAINIFRRYFLHNAWGWAGELNGFVYAWIAFISAAYTMADDGHIKITLIKDRFGDKADHFIRIFTDLFAIAGFVLLVPQTIKALSSMTYTAALRWPKGPIYSGILVGFILYIIHIGIQLVRHIHFVRTGVDFLKEDNL